MIISTHPRCNFSLSRRLKTSLCVIACLFSAEIFAVTPDSQITGAPNMPGMSLMALLGDGFGDLMVPVLGRATNFFYLDPQGMMHSNDEYAGSIGLGQRWLNKAGILGAYVFADYNRSQSSSFWFVSPGVERLGERLDFSANLYIPVSSNQEVVSSTTTTTQSQGGSIIFQGHGLLSQSTFVSSTSDVVGMGGDAQIGYRLPLKNNTKIYVGGYYFNPQDATSITGVAARLEVPINQHVNLEFSEAYDNEANNTVKAGIVFDFGGRNTHFDFKGDLADRMLDPVQRNLIVVAGGTHTTQPVEQVTESSGGEQQVQGDISFFVEGDSETQAGDGTFENPYINFNAANVNDANANNNKTFYIESGTYAVQNAVTLRNDQVFGRTILDGVPFMAPATGSDRPNITFASDGITNNVADTNDVISALQLHGTSLAGTGINMVTNGAMTVTIEDTTVDGFNTGVAVQNNGVGAMTMAFTNNGFNVNNTGLEVVNQDSGIVNVSAEGSEFSGNSSDGILLTNGVNGVASTGTLTLTLTGLSTATLIHDNNNNGIEAQNYSNGTLNLNMDNTSIQSFSQTNNDGILAQNGAVSGTATGNMNINITSVNGASNIFFNASNSLEVQNNAQGDVTLISSDTDYGVNLTGSGWLINNASTGSITASSSNGTFEDDFGNGWQITNAITGGIINASSTNDTFAFNGNYGVFGQNTGVSMSDVTISFVNPTTLGNVVGSTNSPGGNVTWINPPP